MIYLLVVFFLDLTFCLFVLVLALGFRTVLIVKNNKTIIKINKINSGLLWKNHLIPLFNNLGTTRKNIEQEITKRGMYRNFIINLLF